MDQSISMQVRMDYKSQLLVKDQPPNIPNIITIPSICLLALADFGMPLQGLIAVAIQIKAGIQQLTKVRVTQLISKSKRGKIWD